MAKKRRTRRFNDVVVSYYEGEPEKLKDFRSKYFNLISGVNSMYTMRITSYLTLRAETEYINSRKTRAMRILELYDKMGQFIDDSIDDLLNELLEELEPRLRTEFKKRFPALVGGAASEAAKQERAFIRFNRMQAMMGVMYSKEFVGDVYRLINKRIADKIDSLRPINRPVVKKRDLSKPTRRWRKTKAKGQEGYKPLLRGSYRTVKPYYANKLGKATGAMYQTFRSYARAGLLGGPRLRMRSVELNKPWARNLTKEYPVFFGRITGEVIADTHLANLNLFYELQDEDSAPGLEFNYDIKFGNYFTEANPFNVPDAHEDMGGAVPYPLWFQSYITPEYPAGYLFSVDAKELEVDIRKAFNNRLRRVLRSTKDLGLKPSALKEVFNIEAINVDEIFRTSIKRTKLKSEAAKALQKLLETKISMADLLNSEIGHFLRAQFNMGERVTLIKISDFLNAIGSNNFKEFVIAASRYKRGRLVEIRKVLAHVMEQADAILKQYPPLAGEEAAYFKYLFEVIDEWRRNS